MLLLALVETAMAADILISPLITISGALTQIRRLFLDIFNFRLLDSFDLTCVDTDAQSCSLNTKSGALKRIEDHRTSTTKAFYETMSLIYHVTMY